MLAQALSFLIELLLVGREVVQLRLLVVALEAFHVEAAVTAEVSSLALTSLPLCPLASRPEEVFHGECVFAPFTREDRCNEVAKRLQFAANNVFSALLENSKLRDGKHVLRRACREHGFKPFFGIMDRVEKIGKILCNGGTI